MTADLLVGRTSTIARIVARFHDGRGGGVTLVGPAGIGKSAIARHLVDELGATHDPVWVVGSPAGADIPLGAFSAFLPPAGSEPGISSLVHIRQAITGTTGDTARLLIVDDAHALDETSAALVHQLVATGLPTVITQRSGAPAPESISRLWREQLVDRVDVGPLDERSVDELVSHLLKGTIDPASSHEVWKRTGGNPMFVRELVLGGRDADEWRPGPAGWLWSARTAAPPRLTELLRDRFDRLTTEQRSALEHLAFAEPMGLGEFEPICGFEILEQLEALELVTADVDRRRLSIRFTHPLHAEVVRRNVSPLRARIIRTTLVEALRATGARRRDDMMKLATLAVDAASPIDADVLVGAARTALITGERATALRLAAAAFEQSPTFVTGHALADTLYEEGRFDEISAHWSAWEPLATEPEQRAFVAMHQAITHYYRNRDETTAFAVLDRAVAGTPAGPIADEVLALSATLHTMSGRIDIALGLAQPLLASTTSPRVMVQAGLAATQALRARAATTEALELTRRAVDALDRLGTAESLVSSTVFRTGEAAILLASGRFDDALRSADRSYDAARASGVAAAEGLAQLSRSEALTMRCHWLDALDAARTAEAAFARAGHPGFRSWAIAQRSYVAARAGNHQGVADAFAELAALGDLPTALFGYVTVMARAVDRGVEGADPHVDATLLAARECAARGDIHGAIRIVYELVCLGLTAGDDDLLAWSERSDAPLHQAMADHVRARGDHVRLGAAADRLAAMGALSFASDAARQAATEAERAGDAAATREWRRREAVWTADGQQLTSAPAAAPATPRVPTTDLTRREHEVALLAAQGMSSRAVGERLFLSPRTVENHLAKAYAKLHVRSRAELSHALASA